jgi:hypothetical protein
MQGSRDAPLHIIVQLLKRVARALGEYGEKVLVLVVHLAPFNLDFHSLACSCWWNAWLQQHGCCVRKHIALSLGAGAQKHGTLSIGCPDSDGIDLHAQHTCVRELGTVVRAVKSILPRGIIAHVFVTWQLYRHVNVTSRSAYFYNGMLPEGM